VTSLAPLYRGIAGDHGSLAMKARAAGATNTCDPLTITN